MMTPPDPAREGFPRFAAGLSLDLAAQNQELRAQLTAARARAERAEGALVEIRAEMPATCTCAPAYSGRHLADPSCGYHDYGALCLEIIDRALAARGE